MFLRSDCGRTCPADPSGPQADERALSGPARDDWDLSRPSRYVPVICILSQWFALESARMSADIPGATHDYSTSPAGSRAPRGTRPGAVAGAGALRAVLAAAGLAGVVLLVVSTFTTVVEVRVLTTSDLAAQDSSITGQDLHGIALLLVGLFGLAMLAGALRGARPAMLALAATGLLALGLVVGLDVPELDSTGQLAEFYEDVSAGAAVGFYLETLGAVLLLLTGVLLLVLAGRER
ncbi:MAG: hypothetical protein JWO90_2481 [Solirubrobacterales bacterium]|nr:hypothetical protein [Solirubrobacterales bacterium]